MAQTAEAENKSTQNEMENNSGPKRERMANLELLRCVAMMMVVVLHYLGKGNLLAELTQPDFTGAQQAAWLLECFCIVAVNVYMFISGYFLCNSSFKFSRLIQLLLQVWFYSVVFGLAGALSGVMRGPDFDVHYLLTLIFPISMGHYWFMTAYIFLYLLLPFVGLAVGKMGKRQMQTALLLLLLAFCIVKSVLPVRFEMDGQGYDCLWYLCVFLTAAYVRRFGGALLGKRWLGPVLYGGGCLLIFATTILLRLIYLRTGSLGTMIGFGLEYNHILPLAAAVGLFAIFSGIRIQGKTAGLINRIAPATLGVYLLHENLGLRYTWQNWLGAENAAQAIAGNTAGAYVSLLLHTAAAAVIVFVCGVLVETVRKGIFGVLYRGFSGIGFHGRLAGRIRKADAVFQTEPGKE